MFLLYYRVYVSSKVKQACDGVDVAIACLGTGIYTLIECNLSIHAMICIMN